MIDYYEELSLGRKLDTKQIQEELVRLESLWHKREVNSPEKANKMLGLIMEAQKVFASEASRRKYDSDLENSKKETEAPEVLRSKSLEKWTNQARMFFSDGQYDLAKASIDRALTYVDSEYDNGDLFQLAANIYLENDDMRLSLECINKAIITSPDWADYYIVKARIYERMSLVDQQYDKRQNNINECRNNLMHAVSKARASGDAVIEGDALGMLAFSLYFHFNPDVALAEEYARRAEALGEYANSKRVLDAITEKKNSPIYNEANKEEGYGNLQHLRKALELYESLGDWKDASERATACRTRIAQLEEEETRRQREEQRRREEQARKAKEAEEERKRRAQEELEAQRKKKEQTIKLAKIATPIVVTLVVVIVIINSFFIPNGNYHSALNLMKSGNYDEAIAAFRALNGFRDSEGKIDECYDAISQEKYDIAVELMNEGKYDEAIAAFDALGNYGDGALQASSCKDAIMKLQYEAAVALMDEGRYQKAIAAFEKIGDYEDSIAFVAESRDNINQMAYDAAIALKSDGKYEEAISAFKNLGNYSDSNEQVVECKELHSQQQYQSAISLMDEGKYDEAIAIFSFLGNYEKSVRYIFDIKMLQAAPLHETIATGYEHSVALKNDGTVVATNPSTRFTQDYGQCDVYNWTDIVAVSAGGYHTVGLKIDGTVVAVGMNDDGQCNVSGWTDIVAISAGGAHTIGLKADGTVIAVGDNDRGQCNVSDWSNIVAIAGGSGNTFGLRSDGTVVAIGGSYGGVLGAGNWTNITKIKAGVSSVAGLKSDGSVLVLGESLNQENVNSWREIIAIDVGRANLVALCSDGTVLREGCCIAFNSPFCDGTEEWGRIYDWRDMVSVSVGNEHCIGLKSDGTTVGAGLSSSGCEKVDDWTDVRIPSN